MSDRRKMPLRGAFTCWKVVRVEGTPARTALLKLRVHAGVKRYQTYYVPYAFSPRLYDKLRVERVTVVAAWLIGPYGRLSPVKRSDGLVFRPLHSPLITGRHGAKTRYRIGKVTRCHEWDERPETCAGGIHAYMTRSLLKEHGWL